MREGCRNLLRDEGISGFEPARRAPGKAACSLILGLVLACACPATAQVDGERSDSAVSREGVDRDGASKEVRPALARRKRNALNQFDPKVFEARGRELQDEFYEITSIAKGGTAWSATSPSAEAEALGGEADTASRPKPSASRNWMIWSGAAGLAAVVGGAAGYLLLEKHTEPTPKSVYLDDDPDNP